MTKPEADAIERLTEAVNALSTKLTDHCAREDSCRNKVTNIDRVLFVESEPGKPGLKRRQEIVEDWKAGITGWKVFFDRLVIAGAAAVLGAAAKWYFGG